MKRTMQLLMLTMIIVGFVLTSASFVLAGSYMFVPFDVPGAYSTVLNGINDSGNIVGDYYDATGLHGFLYSSGAIDVPGAYSTVLNGINNYGNIVGYYGDATDAMHGLLYSGGSFTSIDVPGAIDTRAYGINDSGNVVGTYRDATGVYHGFLYSNGSFTSIDVPGANNSPFNGTDATGINNSGTIVGYYTDATDAMHGFVYSGGSFTSIDVPGAIDTRAYGINDPGDIVGYYTDDWLEAHGFLYSNGSVSTVDNRDAMETFALGINDFGIIVGWYHGAEVEHGFLATPLVVPPIEDFSFNAVSPITVSVGGSASSTVTVNSVNGSSPSVILSVSGLPSGVSATFTPNPVTPPSGGAASSTLTVSLAPFVTPSTFTLTVMGTSGSITHSTDVTVTVTLPFSYSYVTPAWNPANIAALSMAVYDGDLYVGTYNTGGAQVWRYDGFNWTNISPGWMPNVGIYSMAVYNGNLYAGAQNFTGAQVWRYDGTNWNNVSPGWDPSNTEVDSMAVYGSDLYVGTGNVMEGAQVWQYDGTSWSNVSPGWVSSNRGAISMAVYGSNLHVGTANFEIATGASLASQVWRYDGTTWSNVSPGWDNTNAEVDSMAVYGSHLYVGTGITEAQVWRYDGANWSNVSPGWVSGNGDALSMAVYDGNLYVGTGETGYVLGTAQVWRYNGTTWTDVSPGWDSNNVGAASMAVYSANLYVGTNNVEGGTGGQVWQFQPAAYTFSENLTVSPPGSNTAITFSNVSSPGYTSATISNNGPTPPSGFNLLGNYYDVTTTANYTPPVTVCITAPAVTVNSQLLHYENGSWMNKTMTPVIPPTICAEVKSLSPFVIAQPLLPVAVCQNVTVEAGTNCTAPASINNGSNDPDGESITLAQSPAGPYPLGNTPVTLTVTDSYGASSQCTGLVTVIDKTPPSITGASANPSTLWPPNHKMVDVAVNYNAKDNCGQSACKISSVSSNEPITSSDYAIVDAHHVELSADRLGSGNGRIYTIAVTCTDASGDSSNQAVKVTVPHDLRK